MQINQIEWTRGPLRLILGADRKSLVPLLRQTALDRVTLEGCPLALAFDGTYLWVTDCVFKYPNWVSSNLYKIDTATNKIVSAVSVGRNPHALAFDGTYLWVADHNSQSVSKIDPAANNVVGKVGVGPFPDRLAFDGAYL